MMLVVLCRLHHRPSARYKHPKDIERYTKMENTLKGSSTGEEIVKNSSGLVVATKEETSM